MVRKRTGRTGNEGKRLSAKYERVKKEFELHDPVGAEDRFEHETDLRFRDPPENRRKDKKTGRKRKSGFVSPDKESKDTKQDKAEGTSPVLSKAQGEPREDIPQPTGTEQPGPRDSYQKNRQKKTHARNFGQPDQNPKKEAKAYEGDILKGLSDKEKNAFKEEGKGEEEKTAQKKIDLKKARQKKDAEKIRDRYDETGKHKKKALRTGLDEALKHPSEESKRDFDGDAPEFTPDSEDFGFDGAEKTEGLSFRDRQKLRRLREESKKYHKKADKAEGKLPKDVELKIVTDKNGESRLVLEKKTKDEKDIKIATRRSMVKKANREIFNRTWKKEEEKEEQGGYTSDENAQDIFNLGRDAGEGAFEAKDFVSDRKNAYTRKKYAEFNKAEERAFKADAELKYEQDHLFGDSPEISSEEKKSAIKKEIQKRRIKKNYAKEFRENARKAREASEAGDTAVKGIKGIGDIMEGVKTAFTGGTAMPLFIAIVAIAVLIIMVFTVIGGMAVTGGSVAAIAASTYLSDMDDIDKAEVYYTKLETELQQSLDEEAVKAAHQSYSTVDIVISGEIGHDPYTLINYLSATHGVFTYDADLEKEIKDLFSKCYEVEETAAGTLYQVNVKTTPLEDIIDPMMDDMAKGLYYLYSMSHGLVQKFASPCEYYWGMLISKNYGYQQNASTGDIEYHEGVTISVPPGTQVYAGMDGRVTEEGDSDKYGRYLVIYDGEHYTAKYACLKDINIAVEDEVKAGDMIGTTDDDPESISGSSLYFECQYDGKYYNPCFLFAGYAGDSDILKDLGIPEGYSPEGGPPEETGINGTDDTLEPENISPPEPGEILFPGDASDMAGDLVIEEGMKWMGSPYKYGGSDPVTGIDCSGFVDWCFEKSGVKRGLPHSCTGIYSQCIPITAEELKAGDLVFFQGTYKEGISHVGIYCGNGEMIHAGSPVQRTALTKEYYQKHFWGYARLSGMSL